VNTPHCERMMDMTIITPSTGALSGTVRVPSSKPHMQRATVFGLLTDGSSTIVRPAWYSETRSLFDAALSFGMTAATPKDQPHTVHLYGVGRRLGSRVPLWAEGSAFMFRTIAALACLSPTPTTIEGNASMLNRPVIEHLRFVQDLGGTLTDCSNTDRLRVRITGAQPLGGSTVIDTLHSSQVLTAVLLIAPLADRPVTVYGSSDGIVGEGYVDLTIAMMRDRGVVVERQDTVLAVKPGQYLRQVYRVPSDFTALSYIAAAVATAGGTILVEDFLPSGSSSELEFMEAIERLGIRAAYDVINRRLMLSRSVPLAAAVEIDACNMPTVVPTLAAMAPYVDAAVTVRNVAHVNNHKCRRLQVMLQQLERLGCRVAPIYRRDGALDGFATRGRQSPDGGVRLNSHHDHRIFMSLAIAALGAKHPTSIEGVEHLDAGFPGFMGVMDVFHSPDGPCAVEVVAAV
jgi:3-phosphoshikimate 1-carboxyvinyltransferase